ncbi:MAG: hypothetical protein ABJF28_16645 [Nisaea sp.]|uniref:hypothetical protein n=1 Tax=Nisaea sp. TaxID=2024842 RepID=UPI003263FE67
MNREAFDGHMILAEGRKRTQARDLLRIVTVFVRNEGTVLAKNDGLESIGCTNDDRELPVACNFGHEAGRNQQAKQKRQQRQNLDG